MREVEERKLKQFKSYLSGKVTTSSKWLKSDLKYTQLCHDRHNVMAKSREILNSGKHKGQIGLNFPFIWFEGKGSVSWKETIDWRFQWQQIRYIETFPHHRIVWVNIVVKWLEIWTLYQEYKPMRSAVVSWRVTPFFNEAAFPRRHYSSSMVSALPELLKLEQESV